MVHKLNFTTPRLETACGNRTYGKNCTKLCGHCADKADCNATTGHCDICQTNYLLPLCKEMMPAMVASSQEAKGSITGDVVSVSVIVATLAVVGGLTLYRRKKNEILLKIPEEEKSSSIDKWDFCDKALGTDLPALSVGAAVLHPATDKSRPTRQGHHVSLNLPTSFSTSKGSFSGHLSSSSEFFFGSGSCSMDLGSHGYYHTEEVYSSFRNSKPQLDPIQQYLVDRLASGKLRREFRSIPMFSLNESQEAGDQEINSGKNRSVHVVPYDQYRVVLLDGYSEFSATDYINASYVAGFDKEREYIAAQGPKFSTVIDFWRMLWQEKISHVVMLTNLIEAFKPKCQQYWPEKEAGEKSYGPLTVITTCVECRYSFFIRKLSVTRTGSCECREVTQYHYKAWPDHGVPATTSLVKFWRYVSNRKQGDSAPLLVHCSAGVGRTGTFIGLDIGMQMALRDGKLNIFDLVTRLRKARSWMVQAFEQYIFLHEAILEAYTARDTHLSLDQFGVNFPQAITDENTNERIEKEFKVLAQMQQLSWSLSRNRAREEENLLKNRNPNVLPLDRYLVRLTEIIPRRNQYINAVFMPTFRDPLGSILTQLPLPSTLVDFWRLVYGTKVTTIVSLCSLTEENDVEPYCYYWPRETTASVRTGPYTVMMKSKIVLLECLTSYDLSLYKTHVKNPRSLQLLHYEGWTGEVGKSISDLSKLLDNVFTSEEQAKVSKLVIQCSDGVNKSGLFSALCDVINCMTFDQEVDIYMTVRRVQSIVPQAVSTLTQYKYCYQMLQHRLRDCVDSTV